MAIDTFKDVERVNALCKANITPLESMRAKMDKSFNDFYKNITVFETGHTEFKGS